MSADLRAQWVSRWLDVASISDLTKFRPSKTMASISLDFFLSEARPKVRSC